MTFNLNGPFLSPGRKNKRIDEMEFRGRNVVGFMSWDAFNRFDYLIETYDIKTVIELGPFVGLSTCYFAEKVEKVYAVDNFDIESQDFGYYLRAIHKPAAKNQYQEFLDNTAAYPNIEGFKMDFMDAVGVLPDADLVYIDAVQSYPAYRAVVDAYLPKAKKVIAGDDVDIDVAAVRRTAKELGAEWGNERTWWLPTEGLDKRSHLG